MHLQMIRTPATSFRLWQIEDMDKGSPFLFKFLTMLCGSLMRVSMERALTCFSLAFVFYRVNLHNHALCRCLIEHNHLLKLKNKIWKTLLVWKNII